ncbi:hypothetical protein MJO28_006922 [Puccinia striiformis f. sp. tritici]|uniref:Uncharacterized protein n=4 Tax=Puccinia striiformis TaxID=27350 RepID=A0A0L0VGT1_9BASI|nr:hypothetical protein Pst134EA_013045 [Puccinia striiformis f. sp. tritici]KAI9630342.1 hypothetical protein KEM48_014068 [Puccinia striiformis f. sp. tritici PST-130]KNE98477.1 hypothetical protein PSTG_08215 [Puccinia striiformis f. sp. tritici PST-78]POW13801.1 hypothetical protein PSTT_03449 [Puccinia striiformis]KAH9453934.1 hypothetical protein Pst134EB_014034 [Puccinia striiformis f. sp. tritici]KAH9465152.1 hypothetical protein Pst134EA_013045 [Puccinia striiformis f. sp. tritici]
MVHSSGKDLVKIRNWAQNALLVGALEHRSCCAVFFVGLCLVVSLPGVDGATYRTDLPDNGIRFLSPDAEKVIPSSTLLNLIAPEAEGNASALRRSFIAFSIIIPIVAILLAYLSWKRRREDQEIYETVLRTFHTRKELFDRSERLNAELREKNAGPQEWTSVQFPPETETVIEMGSQKDVTQLNEKQSFEKEKIGTHMQPEGATPVSEYPEVAVTIDPHPQAEPRSTVKDDQAPTLPRKYDSPGPTIQAGTKMPSGSTSPMGNLPLDEDEIEEDFPIPENRKIKVDSILIYCEKQKKLSQASSSPSLSLQKAQKSPQESSVHSGSPTALFMAI